MRRIDISGVRFVRLVAIEPTEKRCGHNVVWKCLCDCGNECEVGSRDLRTGNTKSCGCLKSENIRAAKTKHGCSCKNNDRFQTYEAWQSMKRRCTNLKFKQYKDYGGRGITVCGRWLNSFEAFLEDMGAKPMPELSLDRIKNNGNYEPGNCRWATKIEQANNTRANKKNKGVKK